MLSEIFNWFAYILDILPLMKVIFTRSSQALFVVYYKKKQTKNYKNYIFF